LHLLIVIVNYRTPDATIECLSSLAPQIDDVPGTHVVVVDNDSGDDSVPRLREALTKNGWEKWLKVAESLKNRGFAGGNNFGMDVLLDHPEAKYVLLLNSDTIVKPNVLRYCNGKMEADPGIGVMSCLLLNKDQSIQVNARRLPTPLRLAAYSFGLPWSLPRLFRWADLDDPGWDRRTETRDVDWVGGAFMFIRRKIIDRAGGLDTRFFFYGEDAEFCRRVWKHHWRVCYDPGVSVIHIGGGSSDPTRVAADERNAMRWEARYLFQRRCYGIVAELFIRAVDIASFGLRYLKLRLRGRKDTAECAAHRDVLALLLSWPVATSKR
jgi:hypothetical protein